MRKLHCNHKDVCRHFYDDLILVTYYTLEYSLRIAKFARNECFFLNLKKCWRTIFPYDLKNAHKTASNDTI